MNENAIEGIHAVREAFKAGKTIEKLYVQEGVQKEAIQTAIGKAKKSGIRVDFLSKEKMEYISPEKKHQGIIAIMAAYQYAEVEDILALARKKKEDPFLFILDGIEDPHNLGAIIRTANVCGAHGVIIPKNRAVGLTASVVKTSAGAIHYTPVAKVTNIARTIEKLKKEGIWFVAADMKGSLLYDVNLSGAIGLVIGNEGRGISELVKKRCDFVVAIPMRGDIESLNASVAAGVLSYEILRQRMRR